MGDVWQQSQPIIDYISQATKPDAQTQAANAPEISAELEQLDNGS